MTSDITADLVGGSMCGITVHCPTHANQFTMPAEFGNAGYDEVYVLMPDEQPPILLYCPEYTNEANGMQESD